MAPMRQMVRGRMISLLLTPIVLMFVNLDLGAAQALTYINPPNAPLVGSATITLEGMSFAATDPSPTVYLGAHKCATTSFISFTSILCASYRDPAATDTTMTSLRTQIVRATSGWNFDAGSTPKLDNGFTFDSPIITHLSSSNGPTSGADNKGLTITGMNYGAADYSPTVFVGLTACGTVSWSTNTLVSCQLQAGTGKGYGVALDNVGLLGTFSSSFTYDAPAMSNTQALSSTNGPASSQFSVTLQGFNFGSYQNPTVSAMLGGIVCATSSWSTVSSVTCLTPNGVGVAMKYSVDVSGLTGDGGGAYQFSYDAPVMSSTLGGNSPTSGGSTVTVFGLNFGGADYSSSVSIGALFCTTSSWHTSTKVLCAAPAGLSTGMRIGFEASSAAATMLAAFTYDAPTLSSSPAFNAPVTAGTTLTVNGYNFAMSAGSLTVKLGLSTCTQSAWISPTSISCGVPPGSPMEGASVSAQQNSLIGTLNLGFSYDGPVLTHANPAFGPTSGGTRVTISGYNLGASDFTPTVAIAGSAWYPEGLCASVTYVSDSQVICTTTGGAGADISVYLTASGSEFRLVNVFSFEAPEITALSHHNGPTSAGTSITLSGTNFASVDRSPVVKVGTSSCATAAWTSVTQVTCMTPIGYGNALDMSVNVRDQIGNVADSFSYDVPVISFIENSNAPLTSGTTITITGTNLATSNTSPTTKIGSTVCATTSWTTNSAVLCLAAPYGAVMSGSANQPEKDLLVTVSAGSQVGCRAKGFTYDLPVITAVHNTNAPASQGSSVTVTGLNFQPYNNSPTIKVGATVCSTTSWASGTSLSCLSESGVGREVNVNVLTTSLEGTGLKMFSYNAPIVSTVHAENGATSAGNTITLRGTNFGIASGVGPTALIGSTSCVNTVWVGNTEVKCTLAPGGGNALKATVNVGYEDGVSATNPGYTENGFTYDTPVVSFVSTVNAAGSAGASVTVHGLNFAIGDETPSVGVGGSTCGTTSWNTGTSLVCQLTSSGWDIEQKVSVYLGTEGYMSKAFTWDAPVVSVSANANGPTTGGFSVTVSGINFGTYELSMSVMVGSTLCATTSWNSLTSIACSAQSGTKSKLAVAIRAPNVVGDAAAIFSYDAPAPTHIRTHNAVTSGRTSVTLKGFNFAADDSTPSIVLGATLCSSVSWSSVTSVSCDVAAGYGSGRDAIAVIDTIGTYAAGFSYDSPSISIVSAKNAPTTSGALLTISGHNFATSDYTVTASVGKTHCVTTSWLTQTSVYCRTGAGIGPALVANLFSGGTTATFTASFTYDSPVVTLSSATNGPSSANHDVTIHGLNFGTEDATLSIALGPTGCSTASWVTSSQIVCRQVGTVTTDAASSPLARDFSVEVASITGTGLDLYTFDAPVMSAISAPNAPLSSKTSVTITGYNFGATNLSPIGRVGVSACTSTVWIGQTAVRCGIDPGSGLKHNAVLTNSGVVGTHLLAFSYDSPVVTYINVWNAPASAGSTVTISGVNFGAADNTLTVDVGNTQCATTSWKSTSSILCNPPNGKGMAKAVAVTITSNVGTGNAAFTYDAPIMTHLTLLNGPTLGSSTVSISGSNFGVALSATDAVPVASIGKSNCVSVQWLTTTSALCFTPPGVGNVPTRFTVEGLIGCTTHIFSYDAPVILDTTPNGPTVGDATLTLTGMNFGSEDSSLTAAVVDGNGERICNKSQWLTTTSVLCTTTSGTGAGATAALTVAENVGCKPSSFTYDAPVISYTSPNAPVTGRADITIVGRNFGLVEDLDVTIRDPRIGQTQCLSRQWQSDSSVVCNTGPGFGLGISHSMTINSLVGTILKSFTFDAPTITHVSRPNAPTSTGASITIMGHNFVHGFDSSPRIRVGPTSCLTSGWISNTMLKCLTPAGTGSDYKVSLTIGDLVATQEQVFTFGAPVLTHIQQKNAATSGGTLITILGKNFAHSDTSATATIGNSRCKKTSWVSTTSVTCQVSSGVGADVLVSLLVNGNRGTIMEHFSYDPPVITFMQGVRNGPTKSGTELTVLGFNFGQYGDSKGLQVRVGGEWEVAKGMKGTSWLSPTSLTSTTPSGSGAGVEVAVTLANQIGTLSAAYTFDAAIITDLLQSNSPAAGAAVITFTGQNFGMKDFKPKAMVGGTGCAKTTWVSDSSVLCSTAPGAGAALTSNVEVTQVVGTALSSFSYDAPVLTYTMPVNGPTSGGTAVTIHGLNFGDKAQPKKLEASMAAQCAQTVWYSNSQVVCVLPSKGQGSEISPVIDAMGVKGTGLKHFSYDSPVVTHLLSANSPGTGMAVATITGLNFGTSGPAATIGKTSCISSQWISATAVACTVSDGMQDVNLKSPKTKGLTVGVNVASNYGEKADSFCYDSPSITFIRSPNSPISGYSVMTLHGRNFGDGTSSPFGSVGSSGCDTMSWTSDSQVTCVVVPGNGYTHDVVVTAGALQGKEMKFSYDTPVMTSFLSPNAPVSASGIMTIEGFNFGRLNKEPVTVKVGSTNCRTTVWLSSTQAECQVAPGRDPTQPVTMTVKTCPSGSFDLLTGLCMDKIQDSVGMVKGAFSYDSPVVTHYFPRNALPEKGGDVITISGTNFGVKTDSVSASIGPTVCPETKWLSETSVSCTTPGSGDSQVSQLDVVVTVGELISQSGALPEVAFFEDANQFNPFDACPCPEGERAEIVYLSCGPDRDDEYSGLDIVGKGKAVVVPSNGVSPQAGGGLLISATGNSEQSQKLFAMPLYSFSSGAEYSLTIGLSGDFTMMAGNAGVPQDLIIGLGNSRNFYGITKSDYMQATAASYIEGTYEDGVLQAPDGLQVGMDNQEWGGEKPTATPGSVKVRFVARKNAQGMIDLTIHSRQSWMSANGDSRSSPAAQKVITSFNLPGKELGYELVVFRKYQQQTFAIKQININLCGCNDGISPNDCVDDIDF